MPNITTRHLLALALLGLSAGSRAETAPPSNVLSLAASASVDVAKDTLSVVFAATREGADAGLVQTQLKQALDAALAEARKAAKPGQVEVQTGNFSLYPRYGQKGAPSGWQGSAEMVVEGRDLQGIAQLTGRISSMTIARVSYGLSRETREKAEAEATAQAIGRFRARADSMTRLFGYSGYTLREVQVSGGDAPRFPPVPMARAMATAAPADESLPVEAGKAAVTVNVSGSVVMK